MHDSLIHHVVLSARDLRMMEATAECGCMSSGHPSRGSVCNMCLSNPHGLLTCETRASSVKCSWSVESEMHFLTLSVLYPYHNGGKCQVWIHVNWSAIVEMLI